MDKFTDDTIKELKSYVYILIDPRSKKIFYVGKGNGNRVFQHLKCALDASEVSNAKYKTIREIINEGKEVKYYILRHGMTEDEALLVESVFINFLTYKDFAFVAGLTNIVAGHNQWPLGIKTVEDIESEYGATPLKLSNLKHKLLSININKLYGKMDTYEATRASWILSPNRANKCDYVVSEYHGVIRKIYKINEKGWQLLPESSNWKRQRYFFEGEEVTDPEITSLYLRKSIGKKDGTQNPLRYFDKKK